MTASTTTTAAETRSSPSSSRTRPAPVDSRTARRPPSTSGSSTRRRSSSCGIVPTRWRASAPNTILAVMQTFIETFRVIRPPFSPATPVSTREAPHRRSAIGSSTARPDHDRDPDPAGADEPQVHRRRGQRRAEPQRHGPVRPSRSVQVQANQGRERQQHLPAGQQPPDRRRSLPADALGQPDRGRTASTTSSTAATASFNSPSNEATPSRGSRCGLGINVIDDNAQFSIELSLTNIDERRQPALTFSSDEVNVALVPQANGTIQVVRDSFANNIYLPGNNFQTGDAVELKLVNGVAIATERHLLRHQARKRSHPTRPQRERRLRPASGLPSWPAFRQGDQPVPADRRRLATSRSSCRRRSACRELLPVTFTTAQVNVKFVPVPNGFPQLLRDPTANNIYLPGHMLQTGDTITLTTLSGVALPAGTYYVIDRGNGFIQLALTYCEAVGDPGGANSLGCGVNLGNPANPAPRPQNPFPLILGDNPDEDAVHEIRLKPSTALVDGRHLLRRIPQRRTELASRSPRRPAARPIPVFSLNPNRVHHWGDVDSRPHRGDQPRTPGAVHGSDGRRRSESAAPRRVGPAPERCVAAAGRRQVGRVGQRRQRRRRQLPVPECDARRHPAGRRRASTPSSTRASRFPSAPSRSSSVPPGPTPRAAAPSTSAWRCRRSTSAATAVLRPRSPWRATR